MLFPQPLSLCPWYVSTSFTLSFLIPCSCGCDMKEDWDLGMEKISEDIASLRIRLPC